jgi:hypothetical protein
MRVGPREVATLEQCVERLLDQRRKLSAILGPSGVSTDSG